MEQTTTPKIHLPTKENEEQEEWKNLCLNLLQTLPKEICWIGTFMSLYEGFWYPHSAMKGLLYFQKYYKPHKTDIILASMPKSGTTWLKTLTFILANRSRYSLKDSPLLTNNVHQLVRLMEFELCDNDNFPDLDVFPHPRIFATHSAYSAIPCSVRDSENKIVYICRNPFDQFISLWNFYGRVPFGTTDLVTLEQAFETFCRGVHIFGPFWDQIIEYWKASIERPDKVLFLKYEDLKKNNVMYVKILANFLGFPFSEEEEKQGLIQEISNFCAFENMKNMQVNKTGKTFSGVANSAYFRKGEVGDFRNHFSPEMVLRMEKLVQEKLGDINFDLS